MLPQAMAAVSAAAMPLASTVSTRSGFSAANASANARPIFTNRPVSS